MVRFERTGPHWASYLLATISLLILLLAIDGAYVAYQTRSALRLTADYLGRARSSLSSGDVDGARRQATAAGRAAQSAREAAGRPSFSVGSYLPLVNRDLEAVAAITRAAEESANAALAGASVAEELGLSPDGLLPAIYAAGRVDIDAIERASPFAAAAEDALTRAEEALATPGPVSFGAVRDALNEARVAVADARRSATRARLGFSVVPTLLGSDEPKRYMLAFQALGEARATGGLIGLAGVLSAEQGQLELRSVSPILELFPEPLDEVDAPDWFRASYHRQAALNQIQQANVSPHLPAVSEVLLNMFEQAQGVALDGVIMIDGVTLSQMLTAMGPIESAFFDEPITAENAIDVILRESYLRFEDEQTQNQFLADVVQQFWKRVASGDVDPAALASAVPDALATQHLKLYVADPDAQVELTELGAAGAYPSRAPYPQMVFHNNYGVNKVDYFLHRSIETDVVLTEDGNADVTVTATLENQAPEGPPSLLIGGSRVKPGVNRMLLSFQLPEGADQATIEVDGVAQLGQRWVEETSSVVSTVLEIGPGRSREVVVTYFLSGAFDPRLSEPSFEMNLLPQTTVNPDNVSWVVTSPPGYDIMAALGGQLRGDLAMGDGVLEEPLTIRIDMSR